MRAKIGPTSISPDVPDNVSVPSNLSEDLWGEIPKFQAYKQEQMKKAEKEAFMKKRSLVRQTLE